MDAMDRVIAEMSPDDTVAALRLLEILEECRQIDPTEAEKWRLRITGWVRFNEVGAEATIESDMQSGKPYIICDPHLVEAIDSGSTP